MNNFRMFFLVALLSVGFIGQAQEIDNVLDLEFYLPNEVEKWYNDNYEKNIKSKPWVLSDIFIEANTSSKKVGELVTYYEPEVNNYILQFRNPDGKVLKEIRSIGDWGYGIHLNVIGSHDGFARIPDAFLKCVAWVRIGEEPKSLNGGISSYVNQIVSLRQTTVKTIPSGLTKILENGNYVIEKQIGTFFIIRKEVPSDMPCGEDVESIDLNSLPRYELPIKNLLRKDGEITIRVAYPRGC